MSSNLLVCRTSFQIESVQAANPKCSDVYSTAFQLRLRATIDLDITTVG